MGKRISFGSRVGRVRVVDVGVEAGVVGAVRRVRRLGRLVLRIRIQRGRRPYNG